jgi:uncharacterized LabA/DUF88 family protein
VRRETFNNAGGKVILKKNELTYAFFIDYDNLLPRQKNAGILDVVRKTILQIPIAPNTKLIKCNTRIYGGWYEGSVITQLAQNIIVEIQRDFPNLFHLPLSSNLSVSVIITAELAVSLLQEPNHHLFNTYRCKTKPTNIRVKDPISVGCSDPNCILTLVKKILKTGKCPKTNCTICADDLVYRNEQKTVDTLLSCDLIYATSPSLGIDQIILISGDDDFLPPIRTVLLCGMSVYRFHPKSNNQRASVPQVGGQFHEMDL